MPVSLDITIDEQQAAQLERYMADAEAGLAHANRRAGLFALHMARQEVVRRLNQAFGNLAEIERGFGGDQMTSLSIDSGAATRFAQAGNVSGALRVSGEPIPLSDFRHRQTSEGVEYFLGGDWRLREGAFIAEGDVFRREGDERFPIERQFGPSPAAVLGADTAESFLGGDEFSQTTQEEVIDRLVNVDMINFYVEELDRQVEFVLDRGASTGRSLAPSERIDDLIFGAEIALSESMSGLEAGELTRG